MRDDICLCSHRSGRLNLLPLACFMLMQRKVNLPNARIAGAGEDLGLSIGSRYTIVSNQEDWQVQELLLNLAVLCFKSLLFPLHCLGDSGVLPSIYVLRVSCQRGNQESWTGLMVRRSCYGLWRWVD